MHRTLSRWLCALLLCAALPADAEEPRATMDAIFAALRVVFPLSLSERRFADPAERATLSAAFERLAQQGARLEQHGRGRDASFAFLSRSLARDTAEIRDRFQAGQLAEARFLVRELTSDCVACHSRLPSDETPEIGLLLVESTEVTALPSDERVTLEIATRQFDRAQATLEGLLTSPQVAPASLDLEGHLDDYLELSIRVQGDPERAADTLERFAARPDLSEPLRQDTRRWVRSLRELAARPASEPPLARARALLAEADDRERFPSDRAALAHYVAASSALHRYLAGRPPAGPERAEATYRLGFVESRIGRAFWLSQTEYLLEASIREAPGAPFARDAYALLEEFVVAGYTGSSGEHVPAETRRRLAELRGLVDQSSPAGGSSQRSKKPVTSSEESGPRSWPASP